MSKEVFDLQGVRAALFDMDGTMVNNLPYHFKAWHEFTKRHGTPLTEEEVKEITSGKKNSQILPLFLGRELSPQELIRLADEKEIIYRELYTGHITPIAGLQEVLQELRGRDIKIAVATTAQRKNRELVLGELGLLESLDAIVGEEHFTKGKPDPELFLTTAERLGVAPQECVVFDDAPLGVVAARSARMKFVGLTTTHSAEDFERADLTIRDFTEIAFS